MGLIAHPEAQLETLKLVQGWRRGTDQADGKSMKGEGHNWLEDPWQGFLEEVRGQGLST